MGIDLPDLSDVEENQFGGMCPEGWHEVEIQDIQVKPSSSGSGNPVLHLFLETKEGYSLRDWLTISPKTMPNVKAKLAILNYTIPAGPFKLDEQVLIGRKALVKVVHKPYFDTATKEQRTSTNIEMWAKVGAHETSNVTPAPKGDDDIPF